MAKTNKKETEIIVAPPAQVVRALMRGDEMALAISEYRELQKTLDSSMPDQIMDIQGKQFRKKGYWRSIRTAFGLSVESRTPEDQERITTGDDWGYRVTYRATAPSGNYADGDGCCMASEKSRGRMTATEHNVRSHCHTRAFNRAVSNLVGFGEVSAEEIEDSDRHPQQPGRVAEYVDQAFITEPQAKRLWAIAKEKGINEPMLRSILIRDPWNYTSLREIRKADYDAIVKAVEDGHWEADKR